MLSLFVILPMIVVSSSGCIGAMSQLMYVIKGHKVPAKYEGLEEKKVAVLCLSDASAYGPDTLTYTVSKFVSVKLAQGVKDAEIIHPSKIENWIDENGWEESNVVPLGKDVGADMVVVIEIGSYSIHDGATIYKGSADLNVSVYDIEKNGQVSFVHGPDVFSFPENGRPAIQTTERKFETFYLARLTEYISRLFVPHDKMETFADDAMMY
jgi:hypothetical protein